MNPRDTQMQMLAIEQHDQAWNVEEYLAWLCGFEDPVDTGIVVNEEVRRAVKLSEGYYQRVTGSIAVLRPQLIAAVGFTQGATFAAAALGREPMPR